MTEETRKRYEYILARAIAQAEVGSGSDRARALVRAMRYARALQLAADMAGTTHGYAAVVARLRTAMKESGVVMPPRRGMRSG